MSEGDWLKRYRRAVSPGWWFVLAFALVIIAPAVAAWLIR